MVHFKWLRKEKLFDLMTVDLEDCSRSLKYFFRCDTNILLLHCNKLAAIFDWADQSEAGKTVQKREISDSFSKQTLDVQNWVTHSWQIWGFMSICTFSMQFLVISAHRTSLNSCYFRHKRETTPSWYNRSKDNLTNILAPIENYCVHLPIYLYHTITLVMNNEQESQSNKFTFHYICIRSEQKMLNLNLSFEDSEWQIANGFRVSAHLPKIKINNITAFAKIFWICMEASGKALTSQIITNPHTATVKWCKT